MIRPPPPDLGPTPTGRPPRSPRQPHGSADARWLASLARDLAEALRSPIAGWPGADDDDPGGYRPKEWAPEW